MAKTRRAEHAGSWYAANKQQLGAQIDGFLQKATTIDASSLTNSRVKAIIGP
jgi:predicted class III extradiol MEMO1 family dioxygenase